jgi:hypothetical protein
LRETKKAGCCATPAFLVSLFHFIIAMRYNKM